MNPYNLALFCFAFNTLLIGVLIWLKRKDQIGNYYFLFSIFVTVWGICDAFAGGTFLSYEQTIFAYRLGDSFATLIGVVFFHFSLIYTQMFHRFKNLLKVFYALAPIVIVVTQLPDFISSARPIGPFPLYAKAGNLFWIFVVYFLANAAAGFYVLIKKMFLTRGELRRQLKWFIIALSTGFLGGNLTLLLFYDINFPQHGVLLMPLYPFLMAYCMMRTRLFEIQRILDLIQRDRLAMLGILWAGIYHEARSPLYVMQGTAQTLIEKMQEGKMSLTLPESQKVLETGLLKIQEQAARTMDILKRYIGFAKGQLDEKPKTESIDVKNTVEKIFLFLQQGYSLKGIELSTEIPENLPRLNFNPQHFEEILINLILNACEAIQQAKKGSKVMVSAKTEGEVIQVIVQDDGPGMDEDVQAHIFEPFFTTKEKGTGLGLYLVKQLLEKEGGSICLSCDGIKGCVFLLAFPPHNLLSNFVSNSR